MKAGLFLFICYLTLLSLQLPGQIPVEKSRALDDLFKEQRGANPGYALGIIHQGQLIYSQAYGMANLDYDIPLSDSSVFYIGSMSKQFITAALLMLEAEGKLNFEDLVQTYLPEFPVYDHPIRIYHLVHHTSGLFDTNSMQLFQGVNLQFEEYFDNEDLYQLITRQKELNYPPGEEHRYSNAGYIVLARVVEQITGKSLRTYLKERIFAPLGMKDSFLGDNRHEVIKNRVISYWPAGEKQWARRSHIFEAYGDGGVFTTVRDLVKWDRAFYQDLLGVKDFAAKMYQRGKLNNGEILDYARALQIRSHKGQKMITHNGGMLGFRVDLLRFPDQEFSVVLLANGAYLDPTNKALRVADIFLAEHLQEIDRSSLAVSATYHPGDRNQWKTWAGYFFTEESNHFRKILFKNDSLFFNTGNSDELFYLRPQGENTFLTHFWKYKIEVQFNRNSPNDLQINYTLYGNTTRRRYHRFDPTPPQNLEELTPIIGSYHSPALDRNYRIYQQGEKLYLQIAHQKPMVLFPAEGRIFWNSRDKVWIGFAMLKFDQDEKGQVRGLRVGDGRVKGIPLRKLE